MTDFAAALRHVPDFPKPGIDFIDITTVLQDGALFGAAIREMDSMTGDWAFDLIVGCESRGFIFASAMACELGKGLVLIRKKGKLPHETLSMAYELEYGKDELEIHTDAIRPGQRVLIVDDLLASGGTTATALRLIEQLGGVPAGCAYFVELTALEGRKLSGDVPVRALVRI